MPPAADPRERLIVALDFPTAAAALDLVGRLEGQALWFKVGLELFLTAGGGIVTSLRERGYNIFLDLKLHDIPNTVAGAIRSVAPLGASLLTVHASGGCAMLTAAAEATAKSNGPQLLAVTVLTSFDAAQLACTGVLDPIPTQVLRLARMAEKAGIHGMVCSPEEVPSLRAELASNPLLVVPGIRPASTEPANQLGDQRRVATPASAIAAGASKLVVGRPITQSPDPAAATAAILAEIASAL
jgi:orotidine-5'-phosphate decarboxylase